MTEPIYVPVLPARRDAWNAYAQVDPRVRRRIAPLWTLVPHTGRERARGEPAEPDTDSDQSALDRWLTPCTDQLIEVVGAASGWVDAVHVEANVHGAAVSLWRLMTRSGLCLVTGPERHPTLQRYAADLAFLSGRGLGIRVLLDVTAKDPSADLRELVRRLCLPPAETDLILDLGPIADTAESGRIALTALDVLGSLASWRTVVVTSGAFPRLLDSPGAELMYTARRHDLLLHRRLRAVSRRRLLYGDYATEHAFSANLPHVRNPGPPWGLLRYTAPEAFLIGRVPTRGRDRTERVRATARRIARSAAFRGADYSDGERWLYACAHGTGPNGSGNAETWIKMGHLQHMSFVVRQLMADAV